MQFTDYLRTAIIIKYNSFQHNLIADVAVFAGNCITSYSPERGVFESFYEKSERYVRKVR